MAGWTHERGLLAQEIIQHRDEGCVLPRTFEDLVDALRVEAAEWVAWYRTCHLPYSAICTA